MFSNQWLQECANKVYTKSKKKIYCIFLMSMKNQYNNFAVFRHRKVKIIKSKKSKSNKR